MQREETQHHIVQQSQLADPITLISKHQFAEGPQCISDITQHT